MAKILYAGQIPPKRCKFLTSSATCVKKKMHLGAFHAASLLHVHKSESTDPIMSASHRPTKNDRPAAACILPLLTFLPSD